MNENFFVVFWRELNPIGFKHAKSYVAAENHY